MSGDEVDHELTRTERLLSLRSDLQDLEAALARVALVADGTDFSVLADDLEDAFVELDELGVTPLMTHAESASVASDNIGTLLDDRAGVAALRNGLRVASRLIGTILETGLHDWWEGAEPEILIAVDETSPDSQAFGSFATRLNGLLWSMNHAAFALSTANLEHEELLPPVSAVVTNHAEFRDWALSWGGLVVWWDRVADEVRLQRRTALGVDLSRAFSPGQIDEAVDFAFELLTEQVDPELPAITVTEHRSLERVVLAVQRSMDDLQLAPEDRVRLDVLIETLQLQLRTPTPDRPIIARVLQGLNTFAGGLLVGVLGNVLTDVVQHFGVTWPGR